MAHCIGPFGPNQTLVEFACVSCVRCAFLWMLCCAAMVQRHADFGQMEPLICPNVFCARAGCTAEPLCFPSAYFLVLGS